MGDGDRKMRYLAIAGVNMTYIESLGNDLFKPRFLGIILPLEIVRPPIRLLNPGMIDDPEIGEKIILTFEPDEKLFETVSGCEFDITIRPGHKKYYGLQAFNHCFDGSDRAVKP